MPRAISSSPYPPRSVRVSTPCCCLLVTNNNKRVLPGQKLQSCQPCRALRISDGTSHMEQRARCEATHGRKNGYHRQRADRGHLLNKIGMCNWTAIKRYYQVEPACCHKKPKQNTPTFVPLPTNSSSCTDVEPSACAYCSRYDSKNLKFYSYKLYGSDTRVKNKKNDNTRHAAPPRSCPPQQ